MSALGEILFTVGSFSSELLVTCADEGLLGTSVERVYMWPV